MSQDNFQWTADLVKEFCEYAGLRIGKSHDIKQQLDLLMGDFKKLKEEKTKRDWEIVEIRWKEADVRYRRDSNGRFINGLGVVYDENTMLNIGVCVASGDYFIYSVRRLSDGEVFSIGDEVECMGRAGVIIKLDTSRQNNGFYVDVRYDNISSYHNKDLNEIQKVTKPKALFVTEDGAKVFDKNDAVYSVCTKSLWEASEIKAHYAEGRSMKDFWKFFASEEKRDEYILNNKPLLSLMDLLDKWYSSDQLGQQALSGSTTFYREQSENSPFFKRIKELAKQKLSK